MADATVNCCKFSTDFENWVLTSPSPHAKECTAKSASLCYVRPEFIPTRTIRNTWRPWDLRLKPRTGPCTACWRGPNSISRSSYKAFDHGISIPEQYLDGLRQQAPATRIAVFASELYAASGVADETALDFETAEDWSTRQWEAFERADAVLVLQRRRRCDVAQMWP